MDLAMDMDMDMVVVLVMVMVMAHTHKVSYVNTFIYTVYHRAGIFRVALIFALFVVLKNLRKFYNNYM